jgi:hypothetical protein
MIDLEKTQMVQDCQTSDELRETFLKIEPVKGSRKDYGAIKLIDYLDSLILQRTGLKYNMEEINWNLLTRTHGIRAKAMELIYYMKK